MSVVYSIVSKLSMLVLICWWIETAVPTVHEIKDMMDEVRKVHPDAKLVYNNSPSFNWTLNFRQQTYDAWAAEGKDVSAYDRDNLMSCRVRRL